MAFALQIDVSGVDRLTPVMRQVEQQVGRSAGEMERDLQQADHALDRLGDTAERTGQRVDRGFGVRVESAGRRIEAFGSRLSRAGQSLTTGVSIPLAAISLGMAKLDSAAQNLQVASAFETQARRVGVSADELVAAMRQASAGTISDVNLMLSANRGFALGVIKSTKDAVALMEIARDRSRVMGITVTQAFNDIVTGLGRGSPMILDNLGITLRLGEAYEAYAKQLGKASTQLTAEEQKQALVNAVMKQAGETIDRAALAKRTDAEESARLRAELANTTDQLLRGLLPVLNTSIGLFNALPGPVKTGSIALLGLSLAAGPVASGLGAIAQGVGLVIRLAPAAIAGIRALTISLAGLRTALATSGIGLLLVGGGFLLDRFVFSRQPSMPSTPPSSREARMGDVNINFNNPIVRSDDDLRRLGEQATQGIRRATAGAF